MPNYILFLHEDPSAFAGVSPAEMEAIIMKYVAWRNAIAAKGQLVDGHKLRDNDAGKIVRPGLRVSDGPLTEAKEVVGGIFIVKAKDYAEAVEIAKTCPHAEFGTIEIREIEPMSQ